MRTVLLIAFLLITSPCTGQDSWQFLAPGMAIGSFHANKPSMAGDSIITVLRIDPALWSLEFSGISLTGESVGLSARQWSKALGFTAVINAGMFATDHRTHVGYLRYREHLNNDNVNAYQSVAAFDPRRGELPLFRIFDLDSPGVSMKTILRDYASAVQNLRLIKRPGRSRWLQQKQTWSEAALGEDEEGRILFMFCRSPYTMHDLNTELLGLDIGLVSAQHLEGGPQAQLYIDTGEADIELFGSHGSSSRVNSEVARAWPIPNVLGVRPRASPTK